MSATRGRDVVPRLRMTSRPASSSRRTSLAYSGARRAQVCCAMRPATSFSITRSLFCTGRRQQCFPELGQQVFGLARDLLPCRERDAVAAAAGHAPLLVVVLIVNGVVVPAPTLGLEDEPRVFEGEVVEIGLAVPLEWELANEVGDAVREQQASSLHLEGRAG